MSKAEMMAHLVYDQFQLGILDEEVQRKLIILMLNNMPNGKETNDILSETVPPQVSIDELRSRIASIEQDILDGKTFDVSLMEEKLESKYPWLCE